jgi:hypothetical protein
MDRNELRRRLVEAIYETAPAAAFDSAPYATGWVEQAVDLALRDEECNCGMEGTPNPHGSHCPKFR